MWVSDSTSSQVAQRQRRHAAEETQRVDRVATDTAVREEGAIRQAGKAPTREEVQRFRALMQPPGTPRQAADRTLAREGANVPAAAAGDAPPTSTPPTIVDRFRALFQRAPDASSQSSAESKHDPDESSTATRASPSGVAQDGLASGSNVIANRMLSAADQPHTGAAPDADDDARPVAADISKLAGSHGRRALDARDPVVTRRHDDGAADTTQRAAQQVARGEVQTPPVVRKAQDDDAAESDADALSQPLNSLALPSMTPSDMPSAPQRMPDAPQQMAATAGLVAPALAELIQKHVKQMLVSETRGAGAGARSRELLLRMQSDVLPGTDLWLTRTDTGWRMRADVRSRDAYDTLLANQDDLIQRFADGALGELSIEPVFHG
jgi:hypothetical protein